VEIDQKKFEQIVGKWQSLLGIRGTIFGLNGDNDRTIQIQFNAPVLDKLESSYLEESLGLFYVELREFFGSKIEIIFVKIETLDFASHIFWELAAMGLEPADDQPTTTTFFPPSKYPKFYTE
jgi:hypothetical protein